MLIAFDKPFGVISQFTNDGSKNRALAEFGFPQNVYPIGQLDADSEGLLLLSDEPEWNERLLHPRHTHEREYWALVELIPTPEALKNWSTALSFRPEKLAVPSMDIESAPVESRAGILPARIGGADKPLVLTHELGRQGHSRQSL